MAAIDELTRPTKPLRTTPGGLFPYNDQRGGKSLYAGATLPSVPAGFMPGARPERDGAVFGMYPSMAGTKATTYGMDSRLRTGVQVDPSSGAMRAPDPVIVDGGGDGRRMNATTDPRSTMFAGGANAPVRVDSLPAAAPPGSAAAAPTLGAVNPQTDVQRGGAAASLAVPTAATGPGGSVGIPGVVKVGNAYSDSAEGAAAMLARPAGMTPQNQAAFDALGDRNNAQNVADATRSLQADQYAREVAQAQAINEAEARKNPALAAQLDAKAKNAREDTRVALEGQRVAQDGTRLGFQGAQQRLAETKDGREAVKAGFDTRSAQRLEALQATILSPQSTPEQRQQATQAILQLQGKTADDFQIVHAAGGQSLDASGVPVKVPDRLVKFSKRTGQYEEIAPPAPQMPAVPTDKAALVKGTTYQTARGPATWDGKQFVPATGK